jgi:hypothetical protein
MRREGGHRVHLSARGKSFSCFREPMPPP